MLILKGFYGHRRPFLPGVVCQWYNQWLGSQAFNHIAQPSMTNELIESVNSGSVLHFRRNLLGQWLLSDSIINHL